MLGIGVIGAMKRNRLRVMIDCDMHRMAERFFDASAGSAATGEAVDDKLRRESKLFHMRFYLWVSSRKRSTMSPLARFWSRRPAAISSHGEGGLDGSGTNSIKKLSWAGSI
jgi:hypothetical protein